MTEFAKPVLSLGNLTAAADYSTTGYGRAVIQTNQTAVLASAVGARCLGILQNNPVSGSNADVCTDGLAIAEYGGTVAVDDDLICNASGQLISQAAAGTVALAYPVARAIFPGSSGDRHAVLVNPPARRMGRQVVSFNLVLTQFSASANIVTSYPIGALYGRGRIVAMYFVWTVTGTGASAAITINPEIDGVDVTGGVVSLAIGAPGPATVVAGTAITAANAFTESSVLDIEAVVTTAFTAGQGALHVVIG
jgi:hypothetical protein